jgi:hypothetical protein
MTQDRTLFYGEKWNVCKLAHKTVVLRCNMECVSEHPRRETTRVALQCNVECMKKSVQNARLRFVLRCKMECVQAGIQIQNVSQAALPSKQRCSFGHFIADVYPSKIEQVCFIADFYLFKD